MHLNIMFAFLMYHQSRPISLCHSRLLHARGYRCTVPGQYQYLLCLENNHNS